MTQYLCGVVGGKFRPAGGLAQRPASRPDGDPGEVTDENILDGDNQRIAALCALQPDRTTDRVHERRDTIKTRSPRRDRLILLRAEVACAGVPGLNLETLSTLYPQQR